VDTPCILATAAPNNSGYCFARVDGVKHGMHRIAYCAHHGVSLASIKGLVVRHRCDVRRCINPHHLELGTHAENMADMVERGRCNNAAKASPGARNGNVKLSEEVVRAIRAEYVRGSSEHGQVALARKYGTSQTNIGVIVRNEIWKNL
jgi:hypothetical protein